MRIVTEKNRDVHGPVRMGGAAARVKSTTHIERRKRLVVLLRPTILDRGQVDQQF
jgi:hypothetical protein